MDLPLHQASELAGPCTADRCEEVSDELKAIIPIKRADRRRRIEELVYLDHRLAHLGGELGDGKAPRPLIALGKEEGIADAL